MNESSTRRYGPDAPVRQIRLKTDDGCVLALRVLREAQSSSAAPVLFVHALAMDGDMWHAVAAALATTMPEFRGAMLAMDCRGHGDSETSEPPFTTDRFSLDIAQVLDALETEGAHLVGCSMGGTVALAFAGRFPTRLASLTVIDATAWYGEEARGNWEKRAKTALSEGMRSLVEFQHARWFSPSFLAEQQVLVSQAVAVFTANRVPAYAASCRMLGEADQRIALQAYTGPAAVIVGEHDYATPLSMAAEIAARLVGSTLTVIPDARHYTPLEAPELVADHIAAAIRRGAV